MRCMLDWPVLMQRCNMRCMLDWAVLSAYVGSSAKASYCWGQCTFWEKCDCFSSWSRVDGLHQNRIQYLWTMMRLLQWLARKSFQCPESGPPRANEGPRARHHCGPLDQGRWGTSRSAILKLNLGPFISCVSKKKGFDVRKCPIFNSKSSEVQKRKGFRLAMALCLAKLVGPSKHDVFPCPGLLEDKFNVITLKQNQPHNIINARYSFHILVV